MTEQNSQRQNREHRKIEVWRVRFVVRVSLPQAQSGSGGPLEKQLHAKPIVSLHRRSLFVNRTKV
jgi:hypothetical protein